MKKPQEKVKERTKKLEYKIPQWLSKGFILPFQSGMSHFFIFHGDTDGLVLNPNCEEELDNVYVSFRDFLRKVFDEREMVIFYDISFGMKFLTPEMEKEFKKLCGLESDAATSGDPVAAAKAGLAAKRGLPQDPNSCLPLIEKVLFRLKNTAVVIKSAHFIAPNSGPNTLLPQNERINIQTLRNWSQAQRLRSDNNIIILLTDEISKISPELKGSSSFTSQVFIPKPEKEERADFIVNSTRNSRIILPDDFDISALAHATQGMSFRQILEIFLQANKTEEILNLDFVKERKKIILNNEYGELMEIVEAQRGFEDIGGLGYVKTYFNGVLDAIRTGEYRLVPMGIYLMGPPGTGKTALVEALAKEARFNFIKTKNIRSMWLGESEARMEKFIYALRSLAPVVVMNDEADLADAQRDAPKGDSGVSERLMKMWMEFLSDPRIRGNVVVISCTNRPDRIDPALKRSGRGDQRILIPMPSIDELPDIFQVMFKRHNIPTDIKNFLSFARKTVGFSGADIEKIVLAAFGFASGKTVNGACLENAIEDFIPNASQAAIDFMTAAGLLECSSRLLLPPNTKQIVLDIVRRGLIENVDQFVVQIKARKIVNLG